MLREVIWKINGKTKSEEINYQDTDSMDEINDVLLDFDGFIYPSYFPPESSDKHLTDPPSSDDSNTPLIKNEFQNYVIGVYIFFAILFSVGLIVLIVRKVSKACCSSSVPSNYFDYEHVPRNENFNSTDNMGFEHHVSVNTLEAGNDAGGHDSDYDYYTDEEAEDERIGDKPPPYDGPPSYIDLDRK